MFDVWLLPVKAVLPPSVAISVSPGTVVAKSVSGSPTHSRTNFGRGWLATGLAHRAGRLSPNLGP